MNRQSQTVKVDGDFMGPSLVASLLDITTQLALRKVGSLLGLWKCPVWVEISTLLLRCDFHYIQDGPHLLSHHLVKNVMNHWPSVLRTSWMRRSGSLQIIL